ncbi:MAG TPA: DUF2071 domain-containing protein [Anaerolineae bacterium]|nr:DUF2071 domain-containing protein [Anaerolineae bacterium]
MEQKRAFLTAEWRHLLMINYEIDPVFLAPYVPQGTELDQWGGRTYVSMVGFMFLNTKVLGVKVPWHVNFEEVNLRFYVRRWDGEAWRRGVVFIKELVPRLAIASMARAFYNENYVALPMRHTWLENQPNGENVAAYLWRFERRWHYMRARTVGQAKPLTAGSEEEFITEHYWGYAVQRDGGTVEYQVEHPPWNVWAVKDVVFDCDIASLYGTEFEQALQAEPISAFVADGSPVTVRQGRRLELE